MAILNKLPGLEVTININGVPLQEYKQDSDDLYEASPGLSGEWQDARTVCKYIEAATDTEFSIVVTGEPEFERSSPSLICALYIDGKWVWEPIFTEPTLRRPKFRSETKGIFVDMPTGRGDQSLLKKFKFAKIETTSDDARVGDLKNDTERMGKVGEILVKIYRGDKGEPSQNKLTSFDPLGDGSGEVHEKALKGQAKSHSVLLGPADEMVKTPLYHTTKRIDGDGFPIAIFKFKYRSREALKSLLIIERTPEPSVTPEPDEPINVDELSASQKAKLDKFLKGLTGKNVSRPDRSVKREHDNGEGSSSGQERKRSRVSGQKIEIDLTGDDSD